MVRLGGGRTILQDMGSLGGSLVVVHSTGYVLSGVCFTVFAGCQPWWRYAVC